MPDGCRLGIKLLADLRLVFGNEESIPTERILSELHKIEESPWGDLKGKALDARGLSQRLRPYDIKPTTIRNISTSHKGYRGEDMHDAWLRYLGPTVTDAEANHLHSSRGQIEGENRSPANVGPPHLESVTSVTSETDVDFPEEDASPKRNWFTQSDEDLARAAAGNGGAA